MASDPTEAMCDAARGLFLYFGQSTTMSLGEHLAEGGYATAGLTPDQLAHRGIFPKSERAAMVWNVMEAARNGAPAATCLPPEPLKEGWHWLQHANGGRIVSRWVPSRGAAGHLGLWDASAMGPPGVTPEQRAAWGWRWHARCPSPEELQAAAEPASMAEIERLMQERAHARKAALAETLALVEMDPLQLAINTPDAPIFDIESETPSKWYRRVLRLAVRQIQERAHGQ